MCLKCVPCNVPCNVDTYACHINKDTGFLKYDAMNF